MDRSAQDVTQMMSVQSQQSTTPIVKGKNPKLIWIVLACVVLGVVGGIVVYQQSIKTKTTVKTTPRPVASKAPTVAVKPSPSARLLASPVASSSAQPAGVNAVDDWKYNEYEEENDNYLLGGATSPKPSSSLIASASMSPSPSIKASSTTATKTRVTMPDTTDGVPVTGVFEVTAGTVSVGVLLLIMGVLGLLVL